MVLISSNILRLLLLAELSVPIATFIPWFRMLVTSHIPLASFRLLTGFVATVTPFSFNISKSSPSIQTQCAAVALTSKIPQSARYFTGVRPSCLSLHSSCSLFVSDTCTCILRPACFAISASFVAVSSFDVYSA